MFIRRHPTIKEKHRPKFRLLFAASSLHHCPSSSPPGHLHLRGGAANRKSKKINKTKRSLQFTITLFLTINQSPHRQRSPIRLILDRGTSPPPTPFPPPFCRFASPIGVRCSEVNTPDRSGGFWVDSCAVVVFVGLGDWALSARGLRVFVYCCVCGDG